MVKRYKESLWELSKEEQIYLWFETCEYFEKNTREILDNLDNMDSFKVYWNYYGKKRKTVGLPPIKPNYMVEIEE